MRNSLSRALKQFGHKFDICKSTEFTKSIGGYKGACRELKAEGYGVVKSHKALTPDGKCDQNINIMTIKSENTLFIRKTSDTASLTTHRKERKIGKQTADIKTIVC